MLTQEQFKIIFPKNKAPESWLSHFSLLGSFGISTKEQIAAFCSQIGHESLDLTILEENLNYSAESLLRVFPKYFDPLTATALARKPEDIANVVYANRMGNGNTSSGEGWKYRGRGIIQLTGKQNYSRCSKYIFDDENVLLNDPDLVADDHRVAMQQALWFWKTNSLETLQDIRAISRRVNGGDNGVQHRIEIYERALNVL